MCQRLAHGRVHIVRSTNLNQSIEHGGKTNKRTLSMALARCALGFVSWITLLSSELSFCSLGPVVARNASWWIVPIRLIASLIALMSSCGAGEGGGV